MLLNFVNEQPIHNFNPVFNYHIYENNIIDTLKYNNTIDNLLKLENKILNNTSKLNANDGGTGLGNDSITSRFSQYNLFKINETKFLKDVVVNEHNNFLKELGNKQKYNLYGQCWFNVLRKGEQINIHSHAINNHSYLSGHISVQSFNTSTYYIIPYYENTYVQKNVDGKITLFPSWVKHYTDKVKEKQERISIAFDLILEDSFEVDIIDDMKPHWEKLI